jgi:uncharacterized coiled-coil protein SlyX
VVSEQPDIDRLADTVRETLDYMERITLSLGPGSRTALLAAARAALDELVALARAKESAERALEPWMRERDKAWADLSAAEARAAELERQLAEAKQSIKTIVKEDGVVVSRQARRVAELKAALRDTLTEIDELGTAYTALRKKHEPPYIVYIPWSRPAALAALAGDGGGA